jgi:hypothetical protein
MKEKKAKPRRKLPKDELSAMLTNQGGRCAICRRSFWTGRRMAIDHDHATGQIRGLLCTGCNTGIGMLGDTPAGLIEGARYLIRIAEERGPSMRGKLLALLEETARREAALRGAKADGEQGDEWEARRYTR